MPKKILKIKIANRAIKVGPKGLTISSKGKGVPIDHIQIDDDSLDNMQV